MSHKEINKKILLLLIILLLPNFALAICAKGIKDCRNLKDSSAKYQQCLKDVCEPKVSSSNNECSFGKNRCERLNGNPNYKLCVQDSCNQLANGKVPCSNGKNQCRNYGKSFNDCIRINQCPNQSCKACSLQAKNYWICMGEQCIGKIDKYLIKNENNSSNQTMNNPTTNNINKQPKSQKISSSLISKAHCPSKGARLYCLSSKFESCLCSDGALPILK